MQFIIEGGLIMGIREKLLDFKRRLSDRKMYSITVVLIAAVAIWGIYQYKHAANLRQELDNQYNRSFYDMVGYVDNVQTLLAKSLITSTPLKTATTMQEAWRQANLAQTNLGQLPVSQPVLASTSKFLTQVGDLSFSLNNQNIKGKPLTGDQYKTVEKLHNYAASLSKSLDKLQNELGSGRLRWGDLADKGTRLFSKTPNNSMKQLDGIGKTFQDYPSLIYDGPFSDNIATMEAKGVTGDQLNSEQAKEAVKKFIGADKVKSVTDVGKNDTGKVKTYSYSVTLKDMPNDQKVNIGVTQKGGHIIWMLYNRPVTSKKLNMDQAKKAGRDYLESKGVKNMVDTYYITQDNTATINYAYKQDNVVIYPDLIKLKIALDTGEITGIETKAYLASHTDRTIPKPEMTEEQARKKINPRMKVMSVGLAIIPTTYKTEIFCYEFKGKLSNNDFLVYINAKTGEEEDILMIINTPNGVLTM
jgi:spore germination protein